jgi:hypothetical protein
VGSLRHLLGARRGPGSRHARDVGALAGEAVGHGYFAKLGDSLSHHAFHAATVIVASALFSLLIASDIKHHGVPPRLRGLHRAYRLLRSAVSFHG